jgi:lipopolysaccharide export system protein LptA
MSRHAAVDPRRAAAAAAATPAGAASAAKAERAHRQPLALVACALLLLLPALALGLSTDRNQPMLIDADGGVATLAADGEAHLRGNVSIEQGTLKIEANEAHVTRRAGEFQRIVFTGAPARMQQQLDSGGMTRVTARRIDYDVPNETVVLTGDVVVTQPEGSMRGERITYNMQSGQLTGGETGSRIRMRIEPRQPAAN